VGFPPDIWQCTPPTITSSWAGSDFVRQPQVFRPGAVGTCAASPSGEIVLDPLFSMAEENSDGSRRARVLSPLPLPRPSGAVRRPRPSGPSCMPSPMWSAAPNDGPSQGEPYSIPCAFGRAPEADLAPLSLNSPHSRLTSALIS